MVAFIHRDYNKNDCPLIKISDEPSKVELIKISIVYT